MNVCSRCGEENSERAKFCSACGAPLGTSEREERKVVSVLFVDLVDFTAHSDQADPEDVQARIRPYHQRVKGEIESFGGTVEKFIGDAVMAVFGAPIAHGDDAERAVRSGLKVLEALDDLNANDPDLDLQARAAVTTGETVVTLSARPELGQGFVTGDVVNTASRLQSSAPPGRLLVDEATFLASRGTIAFEPAEAVTAKGKRDPVAVWLAVEPLTAPAERIPSDLPLVGRDRELDLIRSIWQGVLAQRKPHLLTVLGPPGIGKSRITRETVAMVTDEGARVVRGRCLPYRQGTGYDAFAQQVKSLAGIFDTDTEQVAAQKLADATALLVPGSDGPEITDHLALLIGLTTDEYVADRQPLFYSARRFIEAAGADRPTLFVFEDIHWADPSLLDLIDSLASRVRDVPVMFVSLARPELLDSRPGWGGGLVPNTTLHLEQLTDADGQQLAAHLLIQLGIAGSQVAERVAATAEGNPLFIEELAASLGERLTGEADRLDLPTNVKSTIAGRLDGLPEHARSVLLDASVAGRIFWRGALRDPDGAGSLDDALDLLEAHDFVRRESGSLIEGDRQFIFKHILIREVAYATLPRAERRTRHAAMAEFIERASGERVAESAALLAHHWKEAGDTERALEYLIRAAETVERSWAKGEAVKLYTEALSLVPDDDAERRQRLLLRRGLAKVEMGDYAGGGEDLDRYLSGEPTPDRLEALVVRARTAYWIMDPEGAWRFSEQALKLAEETADAVFLGPALSMLSHANSMEGNMEPAMELGDRALEVWAPGRRQREQALHLEQQALHYYWTGQYAPALQHSQQSYALSEDIKVLEGVLRAGGTVGMVLTGLGRTEEAIRTFDRVIAQGRELETIPRWTARALNMSTAALRDVFDLAEARRRGEEAHELGSSAAFALAEVQAGIDLVYADLMEGELGRVERAWPPLWERAQVAKGWHLWLMTERLAAARALLAARAGRPEEAVEAALQTIEMCAGQGRLKYDVTARTTLAEALLKLGRAEQSLAAGREAVAGAVRLGHPPALWRARRVLAGTLEANGLSGDEERQAAADALETFAAGLSPSNRERLLSSPAAEGVTASP